MANRPRATLVAALATVLVVAACRGPVASADPGASTSSGVLATWAPPAVDLSGVPARVHVDAPTATAAWIGSAGGALSATAPDGTSYELSIPEFALPGPLPITMTPVTAVDELELSGGLAGAVFLQPAGLHLAVPATLRITSSRTTPAGTRLLGFDVPDGGGAADLVPATVDGSSVSIHVFHFSAPGAAFGTTQDLQRLTAAPTGLMAGLMTHLLTFNVPWDLLSRSEAKTLLLTAWGLLGRPSLMNVAGDAALVRAVADWRQFVFMLNLHERAGDSAAAIADGPTYAGSNADLTIMFTEGQRLVGERSLEALQGNKALCISSHDLGALANIGFWAGIGNQYSQAFTDWLEAAKGCAEIVLAVANLPTNLVAGGVDSARLQFTLEFSDGTRVPIDVDATLQGGGFTFTGSGATMSAGVGAGTTLTASVAAQQGPPYTLTVQACWMVNGMRRNLCSATLSLPFGGTPPTSPTATAQGPAPDADISGTYEITAVCNSLAYGRGTGHVSQTGASVSMSWSVTLDPDRDAAVRDGLCWNPFSRGQLPTSGSLTGTLTGARGAVSIAIASAAAGPCSEPQRDAGATVQVAFSWSLPISGCVPPGTPATYRANRTGP